MLSTVILCFLKKKHIVLGASTVMKIEKSEKPPTIAKPITKQLLKFLFYLCQAVLGTLL